MAWKKDESGALVLSEGNPVYVGNDGNEVVTSGEYVGQLRGEAAANRNELKKMKETLSAFDGIDPSNAKDALAKLKDIDLSKMIDASKLDDVRSEVSKSFQGKIEDLTGQLDSSSKMIHKMKISDGISNSPFLAKTIFGKTPEVAVSYFGGNFDLDEGGNAFASKDGETIYSNQNPGKNATVDEALEHLINNHPQRDNFLLGSGASGSGAQGSNTNGSGSKSMSRDQFDSLSPQEQGGFARDGGTIDT